jgi:oxygen-independent coproporphyrinogen III oxidase
MLRELLSMSPYQGYAYSYPHKTAYRYFEPPLPLSEVWMKESKDDLFLYFHIPFCEMRCGFCNLFTVANPKELIYLPYLQTLERQAIQVKESIPYARFARIAIGGGTPTYLSLPELEKLWEILDYMTEKESNIPNSVEVSPKTLSSEKLDFLASKKVTRLSMGIQSFIEDETKAIGRPQRIAEVEKALRLMKDADIPIINLDLIYGVNTQTLKSWQYSLQKALEYTPEEIFLYPLYVRPLTGLDKKGKHIQEDFRLALYRFGRDFLLERGYEQITMRLFRKMNAPKIASKPYFSAENGMVGLGVGARSYTRELHYCTEYAVSSQGVKQIIHQYNQEADFRNIHYGIRLSTPEQKRRYLMKSLLEDENRLSLTRYAAFFNSNILKDFPELEELFELQCIEEIDDKIVLTPKGLELSDVIGPWLYSVEVKSLMEEYQVR